MKLKKWFYLGMLIALLLLDYAALDDITTGSEPDHTLEYLILFVSIPVFFTVIYKWRGANTH